MLADILDRVGIEYRRAGEHRHVGRGWIGVNCPFCGDDQEFKLGLRSRYASCWRCGNHSLGDVLRASTGLSWPEIRALLAEIGSTEAPEPFLITPTGGHLEIPVGVGPFLSPHREYLESRGFDPDHLAEFWGLRGIGIAPTLSWRIWIPIQLDSMTVSWTTRGLVSHGKRYINAKPNQEVIGAKSLLFGEDYVRHALVICEGPFDAMKIGPGAVATLGIKWTTKQFLRMLRYPVRVVCFDTEPAAQARARRLCTELSVYPGQTVRVALDAKDPGSASPKEVNLLRSTYL